VKKIIKIEGLTKKFGNLVAVDNINLNVEKGKIFAFLGPNGAGKSTTIKMLTTLLSPTKGKISLNGYDVTNDKNEARKSFGIVFQDPSIDIELTALENMHFHAVLYKVEKSIRKEKTEELLKMVDLWDRKDDFIKNFSGGIKRRLEIARGLLHNPEILFLDEPTLGLDTQTRAYMWEYIKKMNKEKTITVFFTTHYLDEVEKIANDVAIIDKGKIISKGTVDEIKKENHTKSLEEAFLKLTGRKIREEGADKNNSMKIRVKK